MTTHYCQLERDALLHISGPDSLKFLQGQTTCDTAQVTPINAVPGAYCTPKGRVVCDFLLSELGNEHFGLRMRKDLIANSAAVFGKYIIFSKAELAAERDDWQIVGLWGDGAAAMIEGLVGSAPAQQYGASASAGIIAVQLDESGQVFECYVAQAQLESTLDTLERHAAPGEENDWQSLQVKAGIARIEAETIEEFIPQVLNFDVTGHVNFKKGCYTGQEVVARLHYRGTPKRRAYIASLPVEQPPKPGAPLFGDSAQTSIGNVVNAVAANDGVTALVAVTIEAADGQLHLGNAEEPGFTVAPPPYSLEK